LYVFYIFFYVCINIFQELNKNVCANVPNSTNPTSNISAVNKEKAKLWVKERAQNFQSTYDKSIKDEEISKDNDKSESILTRLTKAINKLQNEVKF